jgi:DNA-binding transcriptional MerR regulator
VSAAAGKAAAVGATGQQPPQDASAAQEELLSIGAAAASAGISERALRYYQQLGLITPTACTPGGLRRYSHEDLARVAWIRQMQTLLGLSLDEIAVVLRTEDRLAQIRHAYRKQTLTDAERIELVAESIRLQQALRATVEAKWQGKTVHTGIWKEPVDGPAMVRRLNIDGDGQGDLQGHGGEQRAVLVYQIDSYRHWEQHFGRHDFSYASSGRTSPSTGWPTTRCALGTVTGSARRSLRLPSPA